MPVDTRDPAAIRTLNRGRCFLYVMPCAVEDLLKLGFSRDPLQRMQSLHRRWFEFFDLERALLVEAETVRDARGLETGLRRRLALHNAPVPLTVQAAAGGHGEWYRGAYAQLVEAVEELRHAGHVVHIPAHDWLRDALQARAELLYSWTEAMLAHEELGGMPTAATPAQRTVRDALDAYAALGIPIEERLPAKVLEWYRRAR